MTSKDNHAPSAARRKRLKEREAKEGKNFMKILDSYPMEKYYIMSDRLLQAFQLALDERRLDDAYVFGLRFATFNVESLPKHAQFNSEQTKRLRLKNARQVDEVLKKLESVATRMDAEELRLARQRKEAAEAKRRAEEARRQAQLQAEKDKLHELETKRQKQKEILAQQREELRAQQAAEKQQKEQEERQEMEQSAMEKLRKLNMRDAAAPTQAKKSTRSSKSLAVVSTGQAPHTKEAVQEEKDKKRRAEEKKVKEEEKRLLEQQQQKAREQELLKAKEAELMAKEKRRKEKQQQQATSSKKATTPKPVRPSPSKQPSQVQLDKFKEDLAKLEEKEKQSTRPTPKKASSKQNVSASTAPNKSSNWWETGASVGKWWDNGAAAVQPSGSQDSTTKMQTRATGSHSSDGGVSIHKSHSGDKVPPPRKAPSMRQVSTGFEQVSTGFEVTTGQERPSQQRQNSAAQLRPVVDTEAAAAKQKRQSAPTGGIAVTTGQESSRRLEPVAVGTEATTITTIQRKKSVSPKRGMGVKLQSKLKVLQKLSPKNKKKSTKQVGPAREPEPEGVELKLTTAGPAVVDDFCYHDEAYRAKLTPSEARAIKLLEETIQLQEQRLEVLESSNEREVLRNEAKRRLKAGNRKGALYCLARKRRINQSIEVVKAAIFNMETQIIMLESAVEDREVNKIMKEATDAMAKVGNGARLADVTDAKLGEVLSAVGQGGMDIDSFDEEDLWSELQEDDSRTVSEMSADESSFLSLPTVPQDEVEEPQLSQKEDDSVSRIVASLF